jgi:hypothetical protein
MIKLPYDIIYNIYYYIDDYETANNFLILNKYFTKNYITFYNKAYNHRLNLLLNNFQNVLLYYNNDELKNIIYNISFNDKTKKELLFIYILYKNFLENKLNICNFDYNRKCSWCKLIMYSIFTEGIDFINGIFKINVSKNKLKISSKFSKRSEIMEYFSKCKISNYNYLKRYKLNIENFFIS